MNMQTLNTDTGEQHFSPLSREQAVLTGQRQVRLFIGYVNSDIFNSSFAPAFYC